jgi:hypothetical protein
LQAEEAALNQGAPAVAFLKDRTPNRLRRRLSNSNSAAAASTRLVNGQKLKKVKEQLQRRRHQSPWPDLVRFVLNHNLQAKYALPPLYPRTEVRP